MIEEVVDDEQKQELTLPMQPMVLDAALAATVRKANLKGDQERRKEEQGKRSRTMDN